MANKIKIIFVLLFGLSITANATTTSALSTSSITLTSQGLNPSVLALGLKAYQKARQEGLDKQQLLTIIDYSKPSTEPRLWVFDLSKRQVLFQELVAHGKNSGGNVPTAFSDRINSKASSLGVFLTGSTYTGHHGMSLKLNGLEHGFNDNAATRDIVIHAANYVSSTFVRTHGRLGRSWGCPAINPIIAPKLINTIKNGTLVFAYYPNPTWLHQSVFLKS